MSRKEQVDKPIRPTAGEVRTGGYKAGREEGAERKRNRQTERAGESQMSVIPLGTVMRTNGRTLEAFGNPAGEGPGH